MDEKRDIREILASMSHEHVETLKRAHGAFSRGDFDGVVAEMHPDVEWHEFAETPGTGGKVYRGHEGLREVAADWAAWENFKSEVESGVAVSENTVLLMVVLSGQMPGSNTRMEARVAQLWEMREGKGYRMRPHWNRSDGLKAAGLSE